MDGMLEKIPRKTLSVMGPLNKIWFSFKEATAHQNSMTQLDLVEMIRYLEKSVTLVGQVLNIITYNRRLNVLSAVQKKQKARIIKDQVGLLENASANLFSWIFRGHVKETMKVEKEFKKI